MNHQTAGTLWRVLAAHSCVFMVIWWPVILAKTFQPCQIIALTLTLSLAQFSLKQCAQKRPKTPSFHFSHSHTPPPVPHLPSFRGAWGRVLFSFPMTYSPHPYQLIGLTGYRICISPVIRSQVKSPSVNFKQICFIISTPGVGLICSSVCGREIQCVGKCNNAHI